MYGSNVYIYRHKAVYSSIYIMRIAISIIYVHNDVNVSAYEYVNVYVDDNGYVYRYLCMYGLENEN